MCPEGGSLLYMNQTHILDGHTGVEHSLPVPRLYKDTIELFAKSTVGYTPTLIVGYGGLSGEYYWYQHTNVWENERLLQFTPREVIDARSRRRMMAPETDFNHVLISRGAKQISDAGGSVQLGAHGQLQGLGAHWELWMLQQGGMTPMESLRAATIAGARYLGLDGDIGSLEKGKLADLIVLDRNPLENIRNSESIGDGDDERPAVRRKDAGRDGGLEASGAAVLVELVRAYGQNGFRTKITMPRCARLAGSVPAFHRDHRVIVIFVMDREAVGHHALTPPVASAARGVRRLAIGRAQSSRRRARRDRARSPGQSRSPARPRRRARRAAAPPPRIDGSSRARRRRR